MRVVDATAIRNEINRLDWWIAYYSKDHPQFTRRATDRTVAFLERKKASLISYLN